VLTGGLETWELLSCVLTLMESFDKNTPDSDGDRKCGEVGTSKDSAALLVQRSQAGRSRGVSHTQTLVNSADGCGSTSNHVSPDDDCFYYKNSG